MRRSSSRPPRLPARRQHALKELEVVKGKWANRGEMSAGEAAVGGLFAAEVFAWFCVGEIIGRGGTILDYYP